MSLLRYIRFANNLSNSVGIFSLSWLCFEAQISFRWSSIHLFFCMIVLLMSYWRKYCLMQGYVYDLNLCMLKGMSPIPFTGMRLSNCPSIICGKRVLLFSHLDCFLNFLCLAYLYSSFKAIQIQVMLSTIIKLFVSNFKSVQWVP